MSFRDIVREDTKNIINSDGVEVTFKNLENNAEITIMAFPIRKEEKYNPLENINTFLPTHTITLPIGALGAFEIPSDVRKLKASWVSQNNIVIEGLFKEKRTSTSLGIDTYYFMMELANA